MISMYAETLNRLTKQNLFLILSPPLSYYLPLSVCMYVCGCVRVHKML